MFGKNLFPERAEPRPNPDQCQQPNLKNLRRRHNNRFYLVFKARNAFTLPLQTAFDFPQILKEHPRRKTASARSSERIYMCGPAAKCAPTDITPLARQYNVSLYKACMSASDVSGTSVCA